MKPTLLCVLDGIGLNPNPAGNAVAVARKPTLDRLWQSAPHTTLVTHGERVGLPAGQMGNSEVGHMNIGAGRVVRQWLLRISQDLASGVFRGAPAWGGFLTAARTAPTLHLIGLVSDGGVHSHLSHLLLLLDRLSEEYEGEIRIHFITDGRDTGPRTAPGYLAALEKHLAQRPRIRIATICGRFYAMDRDNRWERTQRAWEAFMVGRGAAAASPLEWIEASYTREVTDEFIEPAVFSHDGIRPGDAVLFWNFREDRMRQLVRSMCGPDFSGFSRPIPGLPADRVLCFTEYDHTFNLPSLFAPIAVRNHLGEVVAAAGLRQLRTAETEKYPHVTYFLNGGVETALPGEAREMVPSPREVRTYDLKPEMSAGPVTDIVCAAIASGSYALIVVNLANGDMVGHTGVMAAAVQAVETVDTCLGRMCAALDAAGGQGIIIADHGNAEQMINYVDGTPHTAHTTFPVPCILYGTSGVTLREGGALCDIAPTLLELMHLPQPAEMTGVSLIRSP